MRLRAIDLPRRDSYVFILDDVTHDEMSALLANEEQLGLDSRAREWGAEGMLVFSAHVTLDEEITPAGVAQMKVALEDATGNPVWTEREERP